MTDTPDLSTLPKRMRMAADVMDEAKKRLDIEVYGESQGERAEWHSDALRKRADIWERADGDPVEVEKLAADVRRAHGDYLVAGNPDVVHLASLKIAHKLIESGWRKGDPA